MAIPSTVFDPYRNYRFRVKVDNQHVAGLSKCTALKRTTEVTSWREGGDPGVSHQLPGKSKYEPVTLEQGITADHAFEEWANLVHNYRDGGSSLSGFRKDLILEVYDHMGRLGLAYNLYGCWVSEYQALPDLDANANAVAIQHIKIEMEGWERDTAVGAQSTG
jgi:phage tail-like protein